MQTEYQHENVINWKNNWNSSNTWRHAPWLYGTTRRRYDIVRTVNDRSKTA